MSRIDLHPEDLLDAEPARLSASDRRRLDAHFASCSACRFERAVASDLDRELAPQPGDDALLARLVAAAAGTRVEARPSAAPAPLGRRARRLAVAAVLLFAAAGTAAALWLAAARRAAPEAMPPAESAVPQEPPPPVLPVVDPAPEVAPAPSASAVASGAPTAAKPAQVERTAADMFSEANQERRRGNAAEAARLYRELMQRFPASREAGTARLVLARLLLDRLDDPAGALALFDRYLAGGGGLTEEALLGRALALGRLGRRAEERAAWEKLVERHPSSVHAERARRRLEALR